MVNETHKNKSSTQNKPEQDSKQSIKVINITLPGEETPKKSDSRELLSTKSSQDSNTETENVKSNNVNATNLSALKKSVTSTIQVSEDELKFQKEENEGEEEEQTDVGPKKVVTVTTEIKVKQVQLLDLIKHESFDEKVNDQISIGQEEIAGERFGEGEEDEVELEEDEEEGVEDEENEDEEEEKLLKKIESIIGDVSDFMECEEASVGSRSSVCFYTYDSKASREEISLIMKEEEEEEEGEEEAEEDEEAKETEVQVGIGETEEEEEKEDEEDDEEGDEEDIFREKVDEDAWLKGLEPMDFVEDEVIEVMANLSGKSGTDSIRTDSEVDLASVESSYSLKAEEISSVVSESHEAIIKTATPEVQLVVPQRFMHPERAKLEEEYRDAWLELNLAKAHNHRLQDQLVQVLCKSEKEYNDYVSGDDTYQERELYVKLFSRYVKLIRHWSEMEDLEKEEVIKFSNLKKEVAEMFDSYIEKKVNTLVGKNRNEKSSKFQLANKLEEVERKKWAEANELQVANLAIKMQMEKLLQLLKQREVIGSNFTLMGYNQLKHDNMIAREIVAQKNEQCESVLRNTKISSQKMTHIKEKLNFVRQQYKTKVDNLYSKEKLCDQIYLELKEAKRARTKARQLLSSLQAKNDLLSYPELLMDYESGIEKTHRLKQHLGKMAYEYNSTVGHLKMLKRKIQFID